MTTRSPLPCSDLAQRVALIVVTSASLLGLSFGLDPSSAHAELLRGQVIDAVTGTPITGAKVRVLGASKQLETDGTGSWAFDLPSGTYELEMEVQLGQELHRSRLVNQYVPQIKPATMHVYTADYMLSGQPTLAVPFGLPSTSGRAPLQGPASLPLWEFSPSDPTKLTVPNPIPRRIRVGRRERPTQGCSNNPVIAIEEMDIDEYVKGVLPPEIGVFRSIPGAAEVYKAFAIAAKSYGLYFMVYYDADNRRTTAALPPNNYTWFHIDDTACNQRYSDERLTITTQSAEAVANKIMVKKGAPSTLDKLEYAASCGKHGTLPEYGSTSALVSDAPPTNSCVGQWCGHNTCAGHEDNPNLAGSDKCLVRGICQWGAANWGEAGKDYLWMISHYQPNLEILDLSGVPNPTQTVKLTGYAYTNPDDIISSAIPTVEITLSDGQKSTTNDKGVYEFGAVNIDQGTITINASKAGYQSAMRTKMLISGESNWASIQLVPDGQPPVMDMGNPAPDLGGADMGKTHEDMNNPRADMDGLKAGRLDALVNTSPGIESGCGCSQSPRSPDAMSLGLLLLGFLGLRRRRD